MPLLSRVDFDANLQGAFKVNLTGSSLLMVLLYFASVVVIGFAFKTRIRTGMDFFQAGRSLPTWIGSMALLGASLGIPEVVAMGALGAQYGRSALLYYSIGAIPALLFVSVFMMPLYYGSKARSVPEFLKMRYDEKTRALQASLFAVMTLLSSGISIYVMVWLIKVLHLFDALFTLDRTAPDWAAIGLVVLSMVIVAAYVLQGGLSSAAYNQAWQFLLLIAGLLPAVWAGLRSAGGWTAVMTTSSVHSLYAMGGVAHAGSQSLGMKAIAIGMAMGFVLATGYWCSDFREIQFPMAAKDAVTARRMPILGGMLKVFLPLLVVLPGIVAIGLPTPRTTTVVREEGGIIYHSVTIIPKNVSEGQGLVPAKVNPSDGTVCLDAKGRPVLDYEMATPIILLHFVPRGLLGLALTAILASFMSGLAANVTAFNTVFTRDLYQAYIRKAASEQHSIKVGRWATLGGVFLSILIAVTVIHLNDLMSTLEMLFSFLNAPMLATLLLGMFWKRATGTGAFVGLLAGMMAAILHHGLTLPFETLGGIHGGWITVLHQYPSDMERNVYGAIFAFATSLVVTVVVSLMTKPCSETELAGLVHSLTPTPSYAHLPIWKRPEVLATGVLLLAVAVSILVARV